MTTPDAIAAIRDAREKIGDRALIGVGTVLDAESGRPVDRFTVLLDEKRGVALTFVGEGQNGAFDWQYPVHFFNQFALQIEADGATRAVHLEEEPVLVTGGRARDLRGQAG